MISLFVLVAATLTLTISSVMAEPLAFTSPAVLYSRQVSGFDPSQIPVSCIETKCQGYVNSITAQNCTTLDCLCQTDIVNALKTCESCVVDANIAGLTQADVDQAIADFVQGCSDAGHPVSGVSGITGGGSSASSSGGGSTAGSGTKTATTGSSSATSPGGSSSGSSSSSSTKSPSSGIAIGLGTGVLWSLFAIMLGVVTIV